MGEEHVVSKSPRAKSSVAGEGEKSASQAMLKGLRILEFVASTTDSRAVGEVAEALGMDKSTVSRLLASLRAAGYVRQGRDRRYQLTSKLLFLTRNFIPVQHLRDVARDSAVRLHEAFSEAIHVAAVDSGEIVFVDYLESPLAVRVQLPTVPSPLHLTAIGRAALSGMSTVDQKAALRHSAIAAGTPLDEVDTPVLREALETARRLGYSQYSSGDDITRLGAAIRNETGVPIGGISVSGPSYRIDPRMDEIASLLVSTVETING